MASSSSAELTRSYSTTRGGILNSTRARPGLRPIALSTPANGSLRMPNPAKDQKREEKVLAKLLEICLGLPQAREVKTWRPTCRRSRVTKRRGAKARRQCRQGLRLPGKNSRQRHSMMIWAHHAVYREDPALALGGTAPNCRFV